jgi:hypothetical protein
MEPVNECNSDVRGEDVPPLVHTSDLCFECNQTKNECHCGVKFVNMHHCNYVAFADYKEQQNPSPGTWALFVNGAFKYASQNKEDIEFAKCGWEAAQIRRSVIALVCVGGDEDNPQFVVTL